MAQDRELSSLSGRGPCRVECEPSICAGLLFIALQQNQSGVTLTRQDEVR